MKRHLLAVAALGLGLGAAVPAHAFHCPADMRKIDAALERKPNLTEAQLAEVRQLRAEGERLHRAGQHQDSVDTLAKAMAILGIK